MDFIKIEDKGRSWYGGAQEWCQQKYMRQYGCGIIACANVIYHLPSLENSGQMDGKISKIGKSDNLLHRNSIGTRNSPMKIPRKDFMELVERLRTKYLLVLPVLGMNGLFMMLGMNRYFRHNRLPYRASWGCLPSNLWNRVQSMQEQGIPVVISVGPNFPKLWGNQRLKLYDKFGSIYRARTTTKAHYVTITEMDEDWLTISSWGRKYYINKSEYMDYMKHASNILFSNILCIRRSTI